MKVLQINSVCGYGSTGRIATDLHRILLADGFESKVAFGRGDHRGIDSKHVIRIGSKFNNYRDALATRLYDRAGFHSRRATKKFLKEVDAYAPDIVQLHNLHGYYLHVGMLFDYLKAHPDIKVVWTLHDCWPFTGHCTGFDYARCDGWKSGCKRCVQKRAYPSSYGFSDPADLLRRKKSTFSGIAQMTLVTPSEWLANLVRQTYLGEYPVRVIPNGIDLDVFRPTESDFRARYGLTGQKIILGVAQVWVARKGLGDFIKLSERLDDGTKIVLVGVDERTIRSLPANIIGIPRTASPQELAEIYSAADVYFNPTYEDNFPTTNLEAKACGCPVVTYPTGGSPESADAVIRPEKYARVPQLMTELKKPSFEQAKVYDYRMKFAEYLKLYKDLG